MYGNSRPSLSSGTLMVLNYIPVCRLPCYQVWDLPPAVHSSARVRTIINPSNPALRKPQCCLPLSTLSVSASSCLVSEGVAELWSSSQSACFSSVLMKGDSGRGCQTPWAPPMHEQRLYTLKFPWTIITQSVVFLISEVQRKSVEFSLCVKCLDHLSKEQDVMYLVEIL